jgi:hypothetical protein
MNTLPDNPFVGPRSFRREEASKFYGRENEARDLLSLVISEQLVLFYAESGAGKSSLINTCLIPGLEERNFEVLPVGRVSSAFMDSGNVDNIYIFNLLISLDQSKRDPRRFAQVKLTHFLNNLISDGRQFYYSDRFSEPTPAAGTSAPVEILPRALIIDQFEEIVSTRPEAWQKREDFFRQLAEAMKADPYLWVVLVMREDYIAALDPYSHLLPGQLRARYYMRRMGVQSALEAIRKPVEKIRPFEAGVPELLVDNMRLITGSRTPGQNDQPVYGEFVEPVQLQVVCYQLWERIQQSRRSNRPAQYITRDDLKSIAKGESIAQFISNALADFYEQAISKVLADPTVKVQERDLRDWFARQLITEAETRGFVYRGAETTAGLPNRAVDILASQYIIRSESKAGGVWVELVHDRFVGPILQANRKWAGRNQKSVLADATAWNRAGKPDSSLYDGKQLESSLAELEARSETFTNIEKEFIRASQRGASRRRQRRLLALAATSLMVIVVLAILLVLNIKAQARQANNAILLITKQAFNDDLLSTANAVIAYQQVELATLQTSGFLQVTPTIQGVNASPTGAETTSSPSSAIPTEVEITPSPFTVIPTETVAALSPFREDSLVPTSAGGKKIRVFKFGNGPRHVVLIGGLHAGFAPSTVKMAEEMKDYLNKNPDSIPTSLTVDIITLANPDSWPLSGDINQYAGKEPGRVNANQVDLNRNWDCDWRRDALWRTNPISGGTAPFSEPETVALRNFFTADKLTVAVVFWEARDNPPSVSPGGCGDFSVYSDPLSRLYAAAAGYRAHDFVAYAVNGDATNWLDSQGIGAITVLLPSYTDLSPDDFNANVNAIQQTLQIYGR